MTRDASGGGDAEGTWALRKSKPDRCGLGHLRIRNWCQMACKPGSVTPVKPGQMAIHLGRLLPSASRDTPGSRPGNEAHEQVVADPYLVLLPVGFAFATSVTRSAVRSYRTLSPLPAPKRRRFAFCGTVPEITLAGSYPAPCFRGARTFLTPLLERSKARPSGHLAPARNVLLLEERGQGLWAARIKAGNEFRHGAA